MCLQTLQPSAGLATKQHSSLSFLKGGSCECEANPWTSAVIGSQMRRCSLALLPGFLRITPTLPGIFLRRRGSSCAAAVCPPSPFAFDHPCPAPLRKIPTSVDSKLFVISLSRVCVVCPSASMCMWVQLWACEVVNADLAKDKDRRRETRLITRAEYWDPRFLSSPSFALLPSLFSLNLSTACSYWPLAAVQGHHNWTEH